MNGDGHSKAEDWLALLFWTLETIAHPTTRNILKSLDAWNYRESLRPQMHRLKRGNLLATAAGEHPAWCLTEQGRLAASGGMDPLAQWKRPWDGKWRLFLFDLPADEQQLRLRLWRWLKAERFGYLQQSVWISPDPVNETHFPLKHLKLTPESVTVIEGRPASPDSDAGIVNGAWDCAAINRRYEQVISVAAAGRKLAEAAKWNPAQMRRWLAADRNAWMTAVTRDPLLPEPLWPENYLGRRAWDCRRSVFQLFSQQRRH